MIRIRREKDGIRYQVLDRDSKVVWERFVRFGRAKRNRAGGADFRLAAQEQERVAQRLFSSGHRKEQ